MTVTLGVTDTLYYFLNPKGEMSPALTREYQIIRIEIASSTVWISSTGTNCEKISTTSDAIVLDIFIVIYFFINEVT
jgi:hypothetical protein